MNDDDFYIDDDEQAYRECPKCGRDYDDIDYEYQACSKCGWDESSKKWGEIRRPSDDDFMSGDADILTGEWN